MRKGIYFTILFLLILFIALTQLLNFKITGQSINEYSYTKAICNEENYCEDYEIHCRDGEIIKVTPTGYSVQYSEKWRDDRKNKNLCE